MRPLFCLAFIGVWGVALTAAATTTPEFPQEARDKLLLVGDAVKLLEQYLVDHPADGGAWYGLGAVHTAAYVNGIDAVEIVLPADGQEDAPRVQLGVPPLSYAKRLESVSKQRAEHLAEAVHAFQTALECDGGSTDDRYLLALGFTLYECRDRFTRNPWPLKGCAFDVEAKDFGAESRWWEDQALAVFRQMGIPAPSEELADEYSSGNEARGDAAWLMLQVLESRHPRSESESKELAILSLSARPAGVLRMTEPLKKALPPQPQELTSLYPLTSTSTATSQYYLRALDASLQFQLAFSNLPIVGVEPEPYHNKPVAPEMLDRIAVFLRYHEETFRLLKEAAKSPACRYPVDLTEGPGMELPHLAPLRGLARLLALKTLWAAETGDQASAAAAIIDCLGLGASVRQEPILISQLVCWALLGIAIEALNDAQHRTVFSVALLGELQDALAAMEGTEGLILAIKGEHFSTLQKVRDYATASHEDFGYSPEVMAQMKERLPTDTDIRAAYSALIAATELPFQEGHAEFTRIHMEGKSLDTAMPRTLLAFTRMQAQLRCARVALAVSQYQQTEGALPESLDVLVPHFLDSVPLDPFDEQPLRYRREGEGFIVYSVGDNLVDDAGVRNLENELGPTRWADVGYSVGMPVDETAEEHR
jgi:hypothetical protein